MTRAIFFGTPEFAVPTLEALAGVHDRAMIAHVILGEQKFVNTEIPDAIAGVRCIECGTAIEDLRSFKCHNWAYAMPALLKVIEEMDQA